MENEVKVLKTHHGLRFEGIIIISDLWVPSEDLQVVYKLSFYSKACVRYFLSNFYFFTKWWPFKNYEKCFLFHLKSSFRSRDIQVFVFFPFFSTLSRFKRANGSRKFMMSWNGVHKFADVSFGITQKQLYITSSNLVR